MPAPAAGEAVAPPSGEEGNVVETSALLWYILQQAAPEQAVAGGAASSSQGLVPLASGNVNHQALLAAWQSLQVQGIGAVSGVVAAQSPPEDAQHVGGVGGATAGGIFDSKKRGRNEEASERQPDGGSGARLADEGPVDDEDFPKRKRGRPPKEAGAEKESALGGAAEGVSAGNAGVVDCMKDEGTPKKKRGRPPKEPGEEKRNNKCGKCGGLKRSCLCFKKGIDRQEARKRAKCEHNRERRYCKLCGGAGICEHDRHRNKCKDCGGSMICPHGRIKVHACYIWSSKVCIQWLYVVDY